jgi:hypothetical protein
VAVDGIEIYRNDVVVIRHGGPPPPSDCERGDVTEFSYKSRMRLAFIAANTDVIFDAMITLTYPKKYPSDGAAVKYHFKRLLQQVKRHAEGPISYLWFIEFQRRGAPHFHVLLCGLDVTQENKEWLSKTWYRIVDSQDRKHLLAGTRLERIRKKGGAARYAVKYAYKMRQKVVPEGYRDVGRFWGHSKDVKPEPRRVIECNHDDVLAGLEWMEWPYQHGDKIHYKTLYGTSNGLTKWFDGDILSQAKVSDE